MYEPVEDLKGRVNALAHGMVALIDVFLNSSKRIGENETERFPLKNAREALMRAFYPQCPPSQHPPEIYNRLECLVKINEDHRQLRKLYPHGACIHIERIQVHEFMAFLYPADHKLKIIPVSDGFMENHKPEAPGYYILSENGRQGWINQFPL